MPTCLQQTMQRIVSLHQNNTKLHTQKRGLPNDPCANSSSTTSQVKLTHGTPTRTRDRPSQETTAKHAHEPDGSSTGSTCKAPGHGRPTPPNGPPTNAIHHCSPKLKSHNTRHTRDRHTTHGHNSSNSVAARDDTATPAKQSQHSTSRRIISARPQNNEPDSAPTQLSITRHGPTPWAAATTGSQQEYPHVH